MGRARVVAGVALCASVAACTASFDDPSTLKDLRVVAVSVEPPEIVVDDPFDLPEEFPEIVARPLIVDPAGGGRAVWVQVVACGNQPAASSDGRDDGDVRDTVARGPCPAGSTVLGEGDATPAPGDIVAPFEVRWRPPREFIRRAGEADPLSLAFGLPVTLQLTVSAGADTMIATKRLIVSPRLSPGQAPNGNPRIDRVYQRPDEDGFQMPVDLDDPERNPTVVTSRRSVRLDARSSDAEAYVGNVFDPKTQTLVLTEFPKETLRFSYYAVWGSFSPGRISDEPSPFSELDGRRTEVTYRAPEAATAPPPGTIDRVFVVVRDERGGSSWVRLALRLP